MLLTFAVGGRFSQPAVNVGPLPCKDSSFLQPCRIGLFPEFVNPIHNFPFVVTSIDPGEDWQFYQVPYLQLWVCCGHIYENE
jgi:hypothetical protein